MACTSSSWIRGGFALALLAVLGCKGDDGDSGSTMASTMTETDPSGSGSSSGSSGTAGSETSTAADSSSSTDPGTSTETTGSGDGRCMPSTAPFGENPPDLPQASIAFDFGAQSCAATTFMSQPPQIVIDVQESGLLDATAFGLEITDTSSGLKFSDPPMGDSQVIDFMPDVRMTFEATTIPDGVPVTIEFEVDPAGPTLIDTSAVFG